MIRYYNAGGASTSAAPCSPCHGYADLTNGVGPNEVPINTGFSWYLRLYKPHTYPVIFDVDNDGLTDNLDNCIHVPNIDQTDLDGDGLGLACDSCPNDTENDADEDGICGDVDICPYDDYDDFDADGVCGDIDNCFIVQNPLQDDTDGDGIGDACDNCVDIPNPDQANYDQDMLGDVCDTVCSAYVEISIELINGSDHDEGKGIAIGPLGTIYVAVETNADIAGQIGSWDAVIRKYDGSGSPWTPDWTHQFGSTAVDVVNDLYVDNSGNAYVIGGSYGEITMPNPNSNLTMFFAKYNSTGQQEWINQLAGQGNGIVADSSGNVYVTSYRAFYDFSVIKFDSDGNELWRKQIGTGQREGSSDLDLDAAGNIYLVGTAESSFGGPNQGGRDIVVVKLSADGTLQWTTQLGTPEDDLARKIVVDSAGNSYVTGNTKGDFADLNKGENDFFTLKLDPSGNLEWKRQYGTEYHDEAFGLTVDSANNVYMTGSNAHLISYDSNGNQRFATQIGQFGYDKAFGVASDGAGNAYIAGRTFNTFDRKYYSFIKKVGGTCQ